jgi:radical SAM superfamily enzyme YgiQ (UPF0313 family)
MNEIPQVESVLAEEMRGDGAILLISCYELGHQPLGIASPLAFLERAGFQPDCLDVSVESFDDEKVARARFIGISVPMHTALRLGVRVAERIREINPTCHICFYGLYAALNADYLLSEVGDFVIGGEYETTLVSLAEALESGGVSTVSSISVRGRPAKPILARLPFSVPSRSALPGLKKYAHIERDGTTGLVGYVEASRGCLHLCTHCPIPPVYGGRFFVIPREVVLEDIRNLVESGATHITFGDPDFLNGPGHSLAILRAMHAEFPWLTFDFTAKVEHILERAEIFPELGRLGAAFMVTAVESLNDTILKILDKDHTRADVYQALGIVRNAGFAFRPTWVMFTPWTAPQDYLDVLDFVESEGLIENVDPVQYSIRLLIPPGSLLLSRPAMKPHLGPLIKESFYYEWKHPDPRMDDLHNAVSALVEEAAKENEDPGVTFYRVRELADSTLGSRERTCVSATLQPDRVRPPRLTEPWFC